jgi:hypothetical protein
MKLLCIFLAFIFLLSCTSSAPEKRNPFEGTTWEWVSSEYTMGDSTDRGPKNENQKGLGIYGKTHALAIWQDTSNPENNFFVVHQYTIEGDTIIFKILFWPDPRFIGRTFKYKYEIKENEYLISGVLPAKKWGLQEHDWIGREVWKRID